MRIIYLLLSFFLFSLTNIAQAQSKEDLAKAKEVLSKADAYFKTNDVDKALELYKEAYVLSNRAEIQYNLGQCYRALKDYENAIKSYKRFLADYKKQSPLVDKAKKFLQESETALEEQKKEEQIRLQKEEEEKKRREEEERAAQASLEEAKRKEEERLAKEREAALKQTKPYEKPDNAKRLTLLGAATSVGAAGAGGAALFFTQRVRQLAPTSAADGSGAEISQKILLARSLGVAADALLLSTVILLPSARHANKKAKSTWEKSAVLVSPSSVAVAVEF